MGPDLAFKICLVSRLAINRITFWTGFVAGVAGCVYMNWRSYVNDRCPIIDCAWTFGFPFPLHQQGGWAYSWSIIWPGLVGDVAFAIAAGIVCGWLCRYLWIASRSN